VRTAFLYEFVTGGGCFHIPDAATRSSSLLREGAAMWRALVEDLAGIPDTRVITTLDVRVARDVAVDAEVHAVTGAIEERALFDALAKATDLTVLIAPEFDGHLCSRATRLERLGVRLASPSSDFIRATSDKCGLAELLRAANVAVPLGQRITPSESLPRDFPYPAVLKPNDGAGSMGLRLIADPESARAVPGVDVVCRLEKYVAGSPCSISFIGGGGEPLVLPPFQQSLSSDGRFTYQGGRRLMDSSLCQRAERLGRDALAALPCPRGYVGIDLILGGNSDGSADYIIEVNPRLTTSYIGLRAISNTNLAEAMLATAFGGTSHVSFSREPVDFRADGTLRVPS